MKITFVLPSINLSGGIRVVAIYASRLRLRGHEVQVIAPSKQKPSVKHRFYALLKGKVSSPTVDKQSYFDELDVPVITTSHAGPITDHDVPDADIVIATWWETAEWVAKLTKDKGVKVYFVQHHEMFDYLPAERVKATYQLPLHKITISKWLVSLMEEEYCDHHTFLVPNSVDTQQFYAPPRVKQSTPTVGLLYSPVSWKGCDVSFSALSRVSELIPDLRIVAFGSTSPSSSLPLPINAQYVQQPAQNEIKDLYANCDVWLCGSRSEGFHLPPLEAMACRCPVVSTAVGGPVDVIEDGVNGYLVPVEDVVLLAQRLVNVLQLSQEKWQDMSNAAYMTAIRYTWDDATDLFEQALETAITRNKEIYSGI
jgi:glycosyltransferase involved in cell wall biosynthesis